MSGLDRVFRGRRGGQERPAAAIVAGLWRNGEQGAWYDPSDLSTMFQDASGTTPVYMPGQGQPDCWIGLQLDKRRGLTRGPERLTNGDFSGGGASWAVINADATHIVTFSGGTLRFQCDTLTPALQVQQVSAMTVGMWYEITVVVSGYGGGSIKTDNVMVGGLGFVIASGQGTYRTIGVAMSSVFAFTRAAANTDITIDSISIRELPGNHRWQGTATSRSVLSARYNLLTKSEDFTFGGGWSSATGGITTTADTLTFTGQNQTVSQPVNTSATPGAACTFSVDLSGAGTIYIGLARLGSGTYEQTLKKITLTELPSRYSVTHTIVNTGQAGFVAFIATVADGSARVVTAGRADLRHTADGAGLPPYQRVIDANTYDVTGFPLYRKPDGVDDWMQTSAVDFSGTDKVTIAAAVRKTGTTRGMILELPLASGAFLLQSDEVADTVQFRSGGSSVSAVSVAGQVSPITRVYQCVGDIANDTATIRVNGALSVLSNADQGSGAFGSGVIYFDRRNGSSLPWSGRDYGTLIVGRLLTAPETAAVEKLLRQKSKAY